MFMSESDDITLSINDLRSVICDCASTFRSPSFVDTHTRRQILATELACARLVQSLYHVAIFAASSQLAISALLGLECMTYRAACGLPAPPLSECKTNYGCGLFRYYHNHPEI